MEKIGLIGIFNEVVTSQAYHGYGYVSTLKAQIENLMNYEVDILNYKSNIHNYKYLFIDEGVNFANSWNKIGGDFTRTLIKLNEFNSYEGGVYYNALRVLPDYQDMVKKRKLAIPYLKKDLDFFPIDFRVLSNGLILGDSHATSVYEPGWSINAVNAKTLHGFLKEGIKSYLTDNCKHLRFYAGNIDIRFHYKRLDVDLKQVIADLEQQLLDLNIDIDIVAPLAIEAESRVIPKSVMYKAKPFYGTFEERDAIRKTFDQLLEQMCLKNGFKYLTWPESYSENGKLKFSVMEPKSSIHLSPKFYMFNGNNSI
jgi:hypothetical protein